MIKLYVYGFVGNLGTKILIDKKKDELIDYFNKDFVLSVRDKLQKSMSKDGLNPSLIMSKINKDNETNDCEYCKIMNNFIVDTEEIGKGGILTSLWKICDRNKWGLRYSLRDIPILQGTIEIANYFDLNPYRLLTKNSFIVAITDEQNNCKIKSDCFGSNFDFWCNINQNYNYEPVLTYIGDITNERKRVRIDGEAEAFLTKNYKDEIDKVILNYTKLNLLV